MAALQVSEARMKRRIAYKIDKRWREKLGGVSPRILRETGKLPWSYQTWSRAHHIRFNVDHFRREREGMELHRLHGIELLTHKQHMALISGPSIRWHRAMRRAGKKYRHIKLNLQRFEGMNLSPSPRESRRGWQRHRPMGLKMDGAKTGRMQAKRENLSNLPKTLTAADAVAQQVDTICSLKLPAAPKEVAPSGLLLPPHPPRRRLSGGALALLVGLSALASTSGTSLDDLIPRKKEDEDE
jgi:hypothetical protein